METSVSPETLQPWQDFETLSERARQHYKDESELPYHNWQHALDVYEVSMQKAQLCVENGVEVDMYVIAAAALYHDAGFWLKPGEDHDFVSKERYSAAVAAQELAELGMPEDKIDQVVSAIESTEKGVACQSVEARVVRQADLANISGSAWDFAHSTKRLYKETRLLAGKTIEPTTNFEDFRRFIKFSYEILSAYNAEDISLGDFDVEANGKSIFCNLADRNIRSLKKRFN